MERIEPIYAAVFVAASLIVAVVVILVGIRMLRH